MSLVWIVWNVMKLARATNGPRLPDFAVPSQVRPHEPKPQPTQAKPAQTPPLAQQASHSQAASSTTSTRTGFLDGVCMILCVQLGVCGSLNTTGMITGIDWNGAFLRQDASPPLGHQIEVGGHTATALHLVGLDFLELRSCITTNA